LGARARGEGVRVDPRPIFGASEDPEPKIPKENGLLPKLKVYPKL
jgi:hypothetical protein